MRASTRRALAQAADMVARGVYCTVAWSVRMQGGSFGASHLVAYSKAERSVLGDSGPGVMSTAEQLMFAALLLALTPEEIEEMRDNG